MTPEISVKNEIISSQTSSSSSVNEKPKLVIVWRNIILMTLLHISALYGIWLSLTVGKWQTIWAMYVIGLASAIGILAGAHRLWSHRSYKATWQLRLILTIFDTMALQNDIYEWCRDHRVHHKFSETDADPHNSNRGFFFAHMGWLLCKKHPDVISKGKNVDLSDLWSDPFVRYQRRYYIPLVLLIWGAVPTLIPYWLWNESLWNGFFMCVTLRYCFVLHNAWLVNSAAHFWGIQPYDKNLRPRENQWVQYFAYGEGYHNYHHAFPWDYSASEHGWRSNFNIATMFIDFFAWIGWAYDRKKVRHDMIRNRQLKSGDAEDIEKNERIGFYDNLFAWAIVTYPIWLTFLSKYIFHWVLKYYGVYHLIINNKLKI